MSTEDKHEPTILMLARNWSSEEYAEYATYTAIPLTVAYINTILKWRDLFLPLLKVDKYIDELRIRDSSPDFFSSPFDLEGVAYALGDGDEDAEMIFDDNDRVVVWADAVKLSEDSERMTCQSAIVTEHHVEWTARPRHLTYEVQTGQISYEELLKIRELLLAKA